MPSFCAVFNCSNRADREKAKSNYRFPSIVKNNGKEGLKLSKVRKEKWLPQILRKDLTERKLETKKEQELESKSCFLLPFHRFSHIKFTILDRKRKYVFYPI